MATVYTFMKRQLKQKKLLLKSLAAAVAVIFTAYTALPAFGTVAVAVNSTKRKLPIYSVATDSPKVAVSFDAAWVGGSYRLIFILKRMAATTLFDFCYI